MIAGDCGDEAYWRPRGIKDKDGVEDDDALSLWTDKHWI